MGTSKLAGDTRRICGYDYLLRHGLDVSPSTLARMEKQGVFPVRIHPTGSRKIAWVVEEVDAYFDALATREQAE